MSSVLIIDDEIDICYLLSGILKHKNLLPNYVNSLSDAALALQKQTPSIIFLDNHLPDGMGMDFIEHIKKSSPGTKIIMITAYDTSADRSRAMELGVDGFIGKPFTRDMIYQTVEQLAY
ncbi:MAG TPA: response regulator [Ferruginibacter sp.]|jgi:two-component system OmpR family response regulator|nr:response regulator [Ferruginibacter sp.]